jgi:hypothetical protein
LVGVAIPETLLSDVRKAVAKHQPELEITTKGNIIVLEGTFVVSGPLGPFDTYQILVGIHKDFPDEEPVVFEIGNRIPKTLDRHVFPKRGNCCLGVWEEWLLTAPDHRFETFLAGIMDSYFFSQTYFENKGVWPIGERSHGLKGVIESFSELLGVECDTNIVVGYLCLLSKEQIKGHYRCPCGSGQRLRKCHGERIRKLGEWIKPSMAKRMCNRIAAND